jgi:CheY-like chemotaxis protein
MSGFETVTIVLVEDDPGHVRLIEKNLRRANLAHELVVLSDGHQALEYVLCEGEFAERDGRGSLVLLLDLNLPALNGYQVLKRLKSDAKTRHIPVIVLTTTDDPREVARCYALGCNVYLTKPVDYRRFSDGIRQLGQFLSVATIPQMV